MNDHFEIQAVAIADLVVDPENAYEHDDADIGRLRGMIEEYGFVAPIVVHKHTMQIIGGHARTEAAKLCGLAYIPAVLVDVDDDQAAALGLALNALYGHWNEKQLQKTLVKLERRRFDLDLTGLHPMKVKDIMAGRPQIKKQIGKRPDHGTALSYQLDFDDEGQQSSWFDFTQYLATRYAELDTIGERLAAHIAEVRRA